ncbi:uncharacterized protein I206_103507 [Kwoniella pini CBS 10737]|uniref:Dynactin subunit 6 n=1 Tax=Kwoniella pini CBS 10737 TaxID=1296096 RepID=A0A1B9I9T8_9TREE|nr:dynactin 6 [Kwoniella pini CBS 10737]OCF52204.1 dynactin 6 [Kwoniella pini CBS 10737]
MSRSSGPLPKITAHSTSIICQDTNLQGDITINEGVVVHPKTSILAIGGPIIIGKNCIIEEGAMIINRNAESLRIGEYNQFMVGCRIEANSIGNWNTFQPRSTVSNGIKINDHCTFSAGTITTPSLTISGETEIENLPSYTTIFGSKSERRTWDGTNQVAEQNLREKHIEYLREIIPKYNRLRVIT